MEKLKVGLVGVGRGTSYGKIFSENPETEITALCDMDEDSVAATGKEFKLTDSQLFTDYDSFLEAEMDIVFLGTPIPHHAEQTIKALTSNKHVLSEVTAADTVKGCEAIWDAVKKSKSKYMLAENCIYMDFTLEWKKQIQKGRIGRIHYAEADYVHEIRERVVGKWRADRAPIHYCSHSLGPILYWMDDYVVRTTAWGNQATIVENVGIGAIDMQVALFETKKGAMIKVLRSSVAARRPPLCAYSIYGTKGFLESGRVLYDNIGMRYFEDVDGATGRNITVSSSAMDAPEAATLGGHGTSEYYLVKDFLDSIRNDTEPPVNVTRAMDMTIPGLIAHESAMHGNVWMDVPRFL